MARSSRAQSRKTGQARKTNRSRQGKVLDPKSDRRLKSNRSGKQAGSKAKKAVKSRPRKAVAAKSTADDRKRSGGEKRTSRSSTSARTRSSSASRGRSKGDDERGLQGRATDFDRFDQDRDRHGRGRAVDQPDRWEDDRRGPSRYRDDEDQRGNWGGAPRSRGYDEAETSRQREARSYDRDEDPRRSRRWDDEDRGQRGWSSRSTDFDEREHPQDQSGRFIDDNDDDRRRGRRSRDFDESEHPRDSQGRFVDDDDDQHRSRGMSDFYRSYDNRDERSTYRSRHRDDERTGMQRQSGASNMSLKSLDDLFTHFLKDMYYAEKQILKSLPGMIRKAETEELKQALEDHKDETEQQIENIEKVFEKMGMRARGVTCQAIDGIIEEAKEIMSESEEGMARDAGIIGSAQAVEHYEITRYGTLIAWANKLGNKDAIKLLEANLKQEKAADEKLTKIAESVVNAQAA